jgi:hypothetical protein
MESIYLKFLEEFCVYRRAAGRVAADPNSPR